MNRIGTTVGSVVRILKAIVPLLVGITILVGIIAWLSGVFQTKIEPGEVEVAVAQLEGQPTDVVHEVTKDYIEEAIGTLKAASRTEISAKVLASIESITVSAGDTVNQGDELIRLNSQEFDARLRQAEENLQAATASRMQAETDLNRASSLFAKKAISQSQFEQTETDLKVATAQEAQARQAVAEAEVVRSYTIITAPRAGKVVDKLASVGDMARPGERLLVLYDATSLRLEAPVLEKLAVRLQVGDKLMVHIDALDRDVAAQIDEIVPQADAPSRSFLVKGDVAGR